MCMRDDKVEESTRGGRVGNSNPYPRLFYVTSFGPVLGG